MVKPCPHLPVGFLTQQSKENFSFLPHVKDSQKTFMVIQRLYFNKGFFFGLLKRWAFKLLDALFFEFYCWSVCVTCVQSCNCTVLGNKAT
jgi:hypothetical protein